jgi:hypothetical protein
MVGSIQSVSTINSWRTTDLATMLDWDHTISLEENRLVEIDSVEVAGDSEVLEYEMGTAGGSMFRFSSIETIELNSSSFYRFHCLQMSSLSATCLFVSVSANVWP